jgi:hypothetical protein
MDSWPTGGELRDIYDDLTLRVGKHKVVTEMARIYGVTTQTARRRLTAAGLRKARTSIERPSVDSLATSYAQAVESHGPRAAISKLAAAYGVTNTTVRQWLTEASLYVPRPRVPAQPITSPCPCGAVATTRYKGQGDPLCFRCYMRTYAADKESNFRRTAREYIAEVKAKAVCVDCGGKFPPCVYHFDHVPERGPKLFNLGSGDYSIETVQAEIAKCDIVCANCHAIRTWITRKTAV